MRITWYKKYAAAISDDRKTARSYGRCVECIRALSARGIGHADDLNGVHPAALSWINS